MNPHLDYIENAGVRVGIATKVGGTIVFLSKNNSANILKSNENLWTRSEAVTAETDFSPICGHTIWLGAQSTWWTQQSVNESKRAAADVWPPDPFCTLGEYTILEKTANAIILQSPPSPIWGVVLTKAIHINPDGSIFIYTTIENVSECEFVWDIWYNTRIDGYARAYVKTTQENCKIVPVLNNNSQEMPYSFVGDYFTYNPCEPETHKGERSSKTFIYPTQAHIWGVSPTHILEILFEHHEAEEIHPEHALIEIYNHTEHEQTNALLELEYHAPLAHLQPGEFHQAWQVWKVFDYNGEQTEQAHIAAIARLKVKSNG
ncbi:MAG: DUF4380 domain-containing protein [Bacteroidales bacterium]|jgi:hypothetical protein|nr:DUF4380 domain-containing protein [Bacteroidales bacterium]